MNYLRVIPGLFRRQKRKHSGAVILILHGYSRHVPDISRMNTFNKWVIGPFGRIIDYIRKQEGFLSGYSRNFLIFPARDISRLLSSRVKTEVHEGHEYSRDFFFRDVSSDHTVLQKVSIQLLHGYTQNQLLRDIDAVSMAHSLEVRVPLLDYRIVELALSLPDNTKLGDISKIFSAYESYRKTGAKRILIDSCKDLLPHDIDLQEKRGFGMPFEIWLKGPLKDTMEDALSSESVLKRGLFEGDAIQQLKKQFYRGKVSWAQIWLLMIIELWCREVLDILPNNAEFLRGELIMDLAGSNSYQSVRRKKVLFLAWGYSIHAQRRIQIFVDDPLFDVTVVSTYNYQFSGATTIPLSQAKTTQKTENCHGLGRRDFSRYLSKIKNFYPISLIYKFIQELVNLVRDYSILKKTIDATTARYYFSPDAFVPQLSYFVDTKIRTSDNYILEW